VSLEQIYRCDVGDETTPADAITPGWHILQVKDMFGEFHNLALCPKHWPDVKLSELIP